MTKIFRFISKCIAHVRFEVPMAVIMMTTLFWMLPQSSSPVLGATVFCKSSETSSGQSTVTSQKRAIFM